MVDSDCVGAAVEVFSSLIVKKFFIWIAFYLLPSAFCLGAFCLGAFCLLPWSLLPWSLLPSAFCLGAFCLLKRAY